MAIPQSHTKQIAAASDGKRRTWLPGGGLPAAAPSFVPMVAQDYAGTVVGEADPLWRNSTYSDFTPVSGDRCALVKTSPGPTPPECGGSHYFGRRNDLPQLVTEGYTVWQRMYFYFPSAFSMGYIYSTSFAEDSTDASACGKSADGGNTGTKWLVFSPDLGTRRIYNKVGMTRRQIEQPIGDARFKIESEVGGVSGPNDLPVPRDQWVEIQMAVKVASDQTGWIRLWRDGVLRAELLNVDTIYAPDSATGIKEWGLGDYWNGVPWTDGAAGRADFYMDEIIVASDMPGYGAPTGVDANGNVFIDPATRVGDLA